MEGQMLELELVQELKVGADTQLRHLVRSFNRETSTIWYAQVCGSGMRRYEDLMCAGMKIWYVKVRRSGMYRYDVLVCTGMKIWYKQV